MKISNPMSILKKNSKENLLGRDLKESSVIFPSDQDSNEDYFIRNFVPLLMRHDDYLTKELSLSFHLKRGRRKRTDEKKDKETILHWKKQIILSIVKMRVDLFSDYCKGEPDSDKVFAYAHYFLFFYKEVALSDPIVLNQFSLCRKLAESKNAEQKKIGRNILRHFFSMVIGKARLVRRFSPDVIRGMLEGSVVLTKDFNKAYAKFMADENKVSKSKNKKYFNEKFNTTVKASLPKEYQTKNTAIRLLDSYGFSPSNLHRIFGKPSERQIRNIINNSSQSKFSAYPKNDSDIRTQSDADDIEEMFNKQINRDSDYPQASKSTYQ